MKPNLVRFGFTFSFQCRIWQPLDGCKIERYYTFGNRILINRAYDVKYNSFEIMSSSMISQCHFDNSQTLAQDKLLA